MHWRRWRVHGDPSKALKPKKAPGETVVDGAGYERTAGNKHVHIVVAERALGRPLPPGVEVHHVNEDKRDNRGVNLVICPDHAYHMLLHMRTRALDACGHANWRRCRYCRQWDDPAHLATDGRTTHHRRCANEARRRRYQQAA